MGHIGVRLYQIRFQTVATAVFQVAINTLPHTVRFNTTPRDRVRDGASNRLSNAVRSLWFWPGADSVI